MIVQRRTAPADDILSALVAAADSGAALTANELVSTCYLLLVTGHETTINMIGNGVFALLRHPHQLCRLHQDPALIHSAVEELLRYDSPVQRVTRIVVDHCEISGQDLRDGEFVSVLLAAGNRDPDFFPDPDSLDLGRAGNRHLSFGNGPHFCLGASLARLLRTVSVALYRARHATLEPMPWR